MNTSRISEMNENQLQDSAWKRGGRVLSFLGNAALTFIGAGAAITGDVPWVGHTDSEFLRAGIGVATIAQSVDTYRAGKHVFAK